MSTRKKTEAEKFLDELTGEKRLSFGKMIKSLRLSDNISQVELARRMGKTKQYINDVENGKPVSPAMAAMFAMVMGYSIPMFVSKALNEQLSKDGLTFEVHLTPSTKDFELGMLKAFIEDKQFLKSPRSFILNLLEEKNASHAQAKKLVDKYIINDDEESRAAV